ncbi:hypothetical protein NMY22_g18004 [Coprinellus aureogranulatus]|nr:hypothetical protein NMY22_g18004 [Coprinellus aureogranulatus]
MGLLKHSKSFLMSKFTRKGKNRAQDDTPVSPQPSPTTFQITETNSDPVGDSHVELQPDADTPGDGDLLESEMAFILKLSPDLVQIMVTISGYTLACHALQVAEAVRENVRAKPPGTGRSLWGEMDDIEVEHLRAMDTFRRAASRIILLNAHYLSKDEYEVSHKLLISLSAGMSLHIPSVL